ncbi:MULTISPECIES: C40 family peptidase [unclassified Paenibacillus]|uniref:C40 family peptidase n=1 Tax=unclassified Paenibacillus TaxID=185978 RepID=UPI0036376E73
MNKKLYKNLINMLLVPTLIFGGLSACSSKKVPNVTDGAKPYATNDARPFKAKEEADNAQWEKTADAIIAEGVRYMGVPYVYGAERFNDKAFDCSSYVQYLYAKQGIHLGYNAREQAAQGQDVPFINLRKGDIMFFSDEDFPNETGLNKVRHVGIYMGDGHILHTYEEGTGVIISNIHKDKKEGEYWYQNYLFAKRLIPG